SLILSSFAVSDTTLNYSGLLNIAIDPFGIEILTVYFLSNSVGYYSGSFSFATNDPGQPNIEIGITANIVEPPIIAVSSDTLFFSNISEPQDYIVANNGQSDLLFSFSVNVDLVATEIPVNEDFTTCEQPDGWSQVSSSGSGWQFGDQGGSTGFPIPDGNGCYAYINDDAQNVNGMSEILLMPELDLSRATSLFLFFSSYFSGGNDQIARVVTSLDRGTTWQTVHEIDYHPNWHTSFINLNDYAGQSNCLIGFYTSDNGSQGSGWAIDNIMVNGAFMQPWLTAEPATGIILPGTSDTLSLTVIADNLEVGEYAGEIMLHSNDPAESIVSIPVALDVLFLGVSDNTFMPDSYTLYQNYPNPFNPETAIEYDIPFTSDVRINIYDLTGAEIHSFSFNQLQPGRYKAQWNGTNNRGQSVSSGMYIYQIIALNKNKVSFTNAKKMLLMK
ncbi:MAG: T9SS type A sorting domain-containing protein, partial [Candidatus Marinimicrobia bacterium]|nr:T9SS type A sorting domain-containing protein [Candidatus Neomarinimicrobiota bacterium]